MRILLGILGARGLRE